MFPVRTKVEPKPESAFSLVELVLVVALVGVLFLLAISANAKPRNRVFLTTDAGNHRQLMQAMISFGADHNGDIPNPGWGTATTSWVYAANPPLGGVGTFAFFQTIYPQQMASLTNGQLFPYLQDPRVFVCPADRPDNTLFWARNVYTTSYTWNGAVCSGSAQATNKLSQFRPDAILQWEADDRIPFVFNDGSSFPDEGPSLRHGTNNLVGMFGGGVGTINTTAWYGNSLAGAQGTHGASIPASLLPNRLWCNPRTSDGRF